METLSEQQLNSNFEEAFAQTDRASAIVSCSLLDELLKKLLKNFLLENSKIDQELFDGLAPLSTTSARINMSYHLGLIDEMKRNDLRIINKIRNIFAHSFDQIDFETASIKDRCNELKYFHSTNPPQKMLDDINTIKLHFKVNATMLASNLRNELEKIDRCRAFEKRFESN